MISVRNDYTAPVSVGGVVLAPGASGSIDPDRPGVRSLLKLGHLVALDTVPGAVDVAAELAVSRAEVVSLKSRVAALEAELSAARATIEGIAAADKPRAKAPKPAQVEG